MDKRSLSTDEREALGAHLRECAACRHHEQVSAQVADAIRTDLATVAIPNADQEWQHLHASLQKEGPPSARFRGVAPLFWFGAPLAAAAAFAFAFLSPKAPHPPSAEASAMDSTEELVIQANYVEVADATATTMVYVDKQSGWLVVWAG